MAHQDSNGAWHSDYIDDEQIINQESGGNPWAMNTKSGAAGLMQLMPATANNPGFGITPVRDNSPAENRRVGTQYLDALVKYYHGDVDKALAAYNWGMGHVDNAVKEHGDAWRTVLPDETRHYINNYHRGEGMNIPQAETGEHIQQQRQAFGTDYSTTPNGADTTVPPVPVNSHFPTIADIQAKYAQDHQDALQKPPSALEQLEHMGMSLLGTVGMAALAGFTGGIPVALGLASALKTHDNDKNYVKRHDLAEEYLKAGYDPIAVRKWAETGDASALYADEKNRYAEYKDERQYGLDYQKEMETERHQQETDTETKRHNLVTEGQADYQNETGRITANANLAKANGIASTGGTVTGENIPTGYGRFSDTDGDGIADTFTPTTKQGTPDKQAKTGYVRQSKLENGKWVDKGYQPEVGEGGNQRANAGAIAAEQTLKSGDTLQGDYGTHSSGLGQNFNTVTNYFTGNRNAAQTSYENWNSGVDRAKADLATAASNNAILKHDMEAQMAAGGKISVNNDTATNRSILNNQIEVLADSLIIADYQEKNHGQYPTADYVESQKPAMITQIYKDHPNLYSAFTGDNDGQGQSGNISSPVGQTRTTNINSLPRG